MIEKERIATIKRDTDLVALIRSKGIALTRKGGSYLGLCPFHDDTNPSLSVTPGENLWQCFGCGAAGDVIRFVELMDKVGFKEAVTQLAGADPRPRQQERRKTAPPPSAKARKLLNRVIDFYHTAFCEDPRAAEYLERRGIAGNGHLSTFKVGFANGSLPNVLPGEGEVADQLRELGVLNDKGNEHLYGCVTFPLYDDAGNPAGIYGRQLDDPAFGSGADHLYLPGPRRGVFNRQAIKSHKEIILTESIIDSLTLICAGIGNTVPCYGTNGLTDAHLNLFREGGVETAYLCFDGDDAGRQGMANIAPRLEAQGLTVHPVILPEGQDINSFFSLTADAKAAFEALLPGAKPEPADSEEGPGYTAEQWGFSATVAGRRYEVRGISRKPNNLKGTVKGITGEGARQRFHVDTVDLYSARSRSYLVKGLGDLFDADAETINGDLQRLMAMAEQYQPPEEKTEEDPESAMTDEERKAAMAFLTGPDLFAEILADMETLGYTGEEMNKLLCYIAAISRKMDAPLSVMIQSRSAAGKSFMQDTVLSLIPEKEVIKYTRLTDQALFYKDAQSLKHRILAIEELDGTSGAIYSIRSIQSSKKITIAYTGKDAATGKLKTEENTVEGPLMVFITTTQVDIDGETASRFVFISIDESQEMTERIMAKQRERHTMAGMLSGLAAESVIKKHRNANRLLRPLKVVNPYAELLTFTSRSLRARRDHTKYLNLILAVTYLHQYQREVRRITHDGKEIAYITVRLEDIARANEIAGEVLGRSLDELSPPSRRLLMLIREMSREGTKKNSGEFTFNRRQIREYSGWSDFQVRTHIRQLEELEYIYAAVGRRGKEYVYELVSTSGGEDGKPFLVGLIDMEALREKAAKAVIEEEA